MTRSPGTLSAVANESESRRWNDECWTAGWPNRERLTEAVSRYVTAAADPRSGQRVCDVGCGGGALSITLASAVGPHGEVVGFDISAPLLELARRRLAQSGVTNVRFVEMDVQTGPWDGSPFHLAISQFGVMFFDEPTAAFRAIRRLLVPGGSLVFACWQGVERNPWHTGVPLRPLLPPPRVPPPGKSPVGPFAFGDDEYVREILDAAGYVNVDCVPHETVVRAPASAVVDRTLLSFTGVPPDREDEAMEILSRHLARFAVAPESDQYDYPLAFMIYRATASEAGWP